MEVSLKDLLIRFKVEEENKAYSKRGYIPSAPKPNVMEHGQSPKHSKYKGKGKDKLGKGSKLGPIEEAFKSQASE